VHDQRVIPCVSGLVVSVCFHTEAWHFGFSRFNHHSVVAQQTADSALAYCTAVSCSRLKRICYRWDIKEINAAPLVAAEVDESTDVTKKAQISVMWLKARWFVK